MTDQVEQALTRQWNDPGFLLNQSNSLNQRQTDF